MENSFLNNGNSLLRIQKLTKSFGALKVLEDCSLEIKPGEVHGLCGENGAGKSTLIKIIAGIWPKGSYGGDLIFENKLNPFHQTKDALDAGISIIHQELSLVPDMNIMENIFLGCEIKKGISLDFEKMYFETLQLLNRLNQPQLLPTTMVSGLAVGQMQIVEIAKALRTKCKLLILDEPTSALSQPETENLLNLVLRLKDQGTSIMYVTHKLNEVFKIADIIDVLRNGKLVDIFSRENFAPEKIIQAMIGKPLNQAFPTRTSPPQIDANTIPFLETKNLCLNPGKRNNQTALRNINLKIYPGEIIGLAGLMGSGRTELLECIGGVQNGKFSGAMYIEGQTRKINSPSQAASKGIALVCEDRRKKGIFPDKSVAKNVTLSSLKRISKWGVIKGANEWKNVEEIRTKLSAKFESHNTLISKLSGGNQQKLIIGRYLLTNPKLLLLDDPTRGIDVGAKFEIYKLINELAQMGICIILCSSENEEVLNLSHRIYVMNSGTIVKEFEGNPNLAEEILSLATGAMLV